MSISTIMAGIATLAPTYDSDVTVKVWTYDSMFDTLNESDCPVRMIGLNDDKQQAEMELYDLDMPDQAEWQILDRCYLFPVALDKGIENYNHKLFDYMESYMTAVSGNKCLGAAGVTYVRRVEFAPPYKRPYPDIDGSPIFWVVDAVLTVKEYR